MLSFVADARGRSGHPGPNWRMDGYRAAGPVVMVIEEGSIWVLDQHGTRQELSAPGVVIWDTGEWVEYGSENPARTAYYWAPRVSDTGFHPCSPDDAPPGSSPDWEAEAT